MYKIENKKYFSKTLLSWHLQHNNRQMPWKGEKDPYKIWLSEIILQQTRVEQGLDYYNRFIANYPTINLLAEAKDNDVFKMWEGLGYYSRCKNILATARQISFELNNIFPSHYEAILQLKGIGPYTAAAIASFAYNLPYAVVDGNVLRVLSRFFNIDAAIDSAAGKKLFTNLAQSLLEPSAAAAYNQAIMDFGATICKPKIPLCNTCNLQKKCEAFKNKTVNILPIKEKKLVKKQRYFYYFIAEYNHTFYVKKRTHKDIWQNLWEFILVEKNNKILIEDVLKETEITLQFGKQFSIKSISPFYKQQLTHQTIEGIFIHIVLKNPLADAEYIAVTNKALGKLAFPRFITNYFEKISLI